MTIRFCPTAINLDCRKMLYDGQFFKPFTFNLVCRITAKVVCLLLFAPAFANAQSCGTGTARQARTASLRRAGVAILNAIKKKDTEGFLSYVESGGIIFGPDKLPISRRELRRQFAHKEGAYCLFFSTECIPNMGRFKGLEPYPELSEWKISYLDWLDANKTYSIFVDLADDAGIRGCNGNFYAESQREMANAPKDIELDFYYKEGRWRFFVTVEGVP